MKIAYLGPDNSYTKLAVDKLFNNCELLPLKPILNIVKAVENNIVDFGVIPLENFYDGEVRETLDSLTESNNVYIIKDIAIEIIHCLGVLKDKNEINKIYSKDTALSQCSKFIYENYPLAVTISTSSTTEAVDRIIKEKLLDSAVIASEKAILNRGLKIISKDLCKNNKTRFIIIGKNLNKQTGNDKTFLVFHPQDKDRPGSLQGYLSFFSNLAINLEYIQSRPDGSGGYYFYVELKGHYLNNDVQLALNALKYALDPKNKYKNTIKILGSYPSIDWKN